MYIAETLVILKLNYHGEFYVNQFPV